MAAALERLRTPGGDPEECVREPGFFTHTKELEVRSALHRIAGKWADVLDVENVEFKPLKGAMTNHIYECHWPGAEGRKVLLRIYGKSLDILFRRKDEDATFKLMSDKQQGPLLLDQIPNGRIEEFIHARTLSAADLRDPRTSAKIAAKLWEFHQIVPKEVPREPMLWTRLRNWLAEALKLHPASSEVFDFQKLQQEISELESRISKPSDTVAFCHNDLQYGNIMLNDADESLTIIDYEYASYNPVAFDIANHFCEMTADYHTDTPHRLDYTKYPDQTERQRFIEVYLNTSGNLKDQSEIHELMKQIDRYELASHIHWGLWGIISAAISDIEFDFLDYARQRFQRYYERKAELSEAKYCEQNGEKTPSS